MIIDIIPCVVVASLEKDALMAIVACNDKLMVRVTSARGRQEGTQGAVAILRKRNVQGCVSDPMNSFLRKVEELGLNASAGET